MSEDVCSAGSGTLALRVSLGLTHGDALWQRGSRVVFLDADVLMETFKMSSCRPAPREGMREI